MCLPKEQEFLNLKSNLGISEIKLEELRILFKAIIEQMQSIINTWEREYDPFRLECWRNRAGRRASELSCAFAYVCE